MHPPHLQDAASYFFVQPYTFSLLGGSPGFSGSRFARITDSAGSSWCLRCWPALFDEPQLRFIHYVLIHSRAHGFAGVPRLAPRVNGNTSLNLNGYLFDAQEWLAGKPLGGRHDWNGPVPNVVCSLPSAQFAALAAALASFHLSTAALQPADPTYNRPLSQWLAGVNATVQAQHEHLTAHVRARTRNDRHTLIAVRWLELLPTVLGLAQRILEAHPVSAHAATTLCHGDLWAAHVFFLGSDFSGFVDFESLSFSSPMLDLAQLIVHFNGWAAYATALQAYEQTRGLRAEEKAVLPAAAILDLASEGYWALNMLYQQEDGGSQRAAHRTNLRVLLNSLELLYQELTTKVL